jgi:Osmosensitive K+ channel histidine kinase
MQARARFSWLTGFVLLIILGLAALGLTSLREDRRAAEQDAKLIAEALANSLARDCSIAIGDEIRRFTEETEASRNALIHRVQGVTNETEIATDAFVLSRVPPSVLQTFPKAICSEGDSVRLQTPDFPAAPATPEWLLQVPSEWLEKWRAAELASREVPDSENTKAQLQVVAQSGIRPLNANALLRLAQIEPDVPERKISKLFDGALFEANPTTLSGTPVGDLALLEAIKAAPSEAWFGRVIAQVASREHFYPSFLTGKLIDELERRAEQDFTNLTERVSAANTLWKIEQNTRPVLRAWRNQTNANRGVFHVRTETTRCFLFVQPSSYISTNISISPGLFTTNIEQGVIHLIRIVPDEILSNALQQVTTRMQSQWPGYLSADLEIAGIKFPMIHSKSTAKNQSAILASSRGTLSGKIEGPHPFDVFVRLADPALLLKKQRMRALIFGGLIAVAAFVAAFGAWQLQKNLNAQFRLNEQKSNFVSSVSHELRAPIASVRLMAESLERGKISEPQKQREYFKFIVQECRRLSSLIENVLDFSRIEQGRKQYQFEPTDLLALTRETVKLMEPYATEKGVELKFETTDIQPSASATELGVDGRAIQQALINLIDNAVKHSAKGQRVDVKFQVPNSRFQTADASVRQHQSAVAISVSDHGPGIPESEQKKIFERFYRLGSELRRETQGVGIGLSIVKHIIEAHGGTVIVESEVGQGSRFTIELPENLTTDEHE